MNYKRRSTHGFLPDFPLLNVFGFSCYTISTGIFLYSPVVRAQYAVRHPRSPEPTVRFNDFAFGVHAWIFCVVVYSQFWPRLWGWEQVRGVKRHAGRATLGILCGSLLGVAITVLVVLNSEGGGSNDGTGWAWLDVVCLDANYYDAKVLARLTRLPTGLRNPVRQVDTDCLEVHSASLCQLQATIDLRLVHHPAVTGFQRRAAEYAAAADRQLAASGLERADWQPSQIRTCQHQSVI